MIGHPLMCPLLEIDPDDNPKRRPEAQREIVPGAQVCCEQRPGDHGKGLHHADGRPTTIDIAAISFAYVPTFELIAVLYSKAVAGNEADNRG
eukprot:6224887-Heterocapsa_arctica.AAC.1